MEDIRVTSVEVVAPKTQLFNLRIKTRDSILSREKYEVRLDTYPMAIEQLQRVLANWISNNSRQADIKIEIKMI